MNRKRMLIRETSSGYKLCLHVATKEVTLAVVIRMDNRKAAQNVTKHGVPFEYAIRVFLDPNRLNRDDERRDYSEERWLTLGEVEGRLFAIAYTRRGTVIRLISARKANEREQRKYDEALSA